MKKLVALLLALCMVLGLMAGCGSTAKPAASAPAADGGNAGNAAAPADDSPTADYNAGADAPTYIMVSKTLSDPIFIDMYIGFRQFCQEVGVSCMYRGTEESTVE